MDPHGRRKVTAPNCPLASAKETESRCDGTSHQHQHLRGRGRWGSVRLAARATTVRHLSPSGSGVGGNDKEQANKNRQIS